MNNLPVLPTGATVVSLQLPESMSFEEWLEVGQWLKSAERSLMWWIGDWLRYGERRWGEMYSQALDGTPYSYQSLANAKWVSGQYEFSSRLENLPWTHHQIAAAVPTGQRAALLERAVTEKWTRMELKAAINKLKAMPLEITGTETCTVGDLDELVRRGVKVGVVYADPPWLYNNQGTRAATGNHYEGMTIDELCELPIDDLAADDAHLHLWTTNGFLFECPKIFEAWGFEFRSSFIWIKPEMGIGNYWRNSHEFLLTAIRGNAKRFNDKALMSWLECGRGQHSAKPEQVRGFIERASPGPRLELFGRSAAPGWMVWGNQVERGLFYRDVPEVAA